MSSHKHHYFSILVLKNVTHPPIINDDRIRVQLKILRRDDGLQWFEGRVRY